MAEYVQFKRCLTLETQSIEGVVLFAFLAVLLTHPFPLALLRRTVVLVCNAYQIQTLNMIPSIVDSICLADIEVSQNLRKQIVKV